MAAKRKAVSREFIDNSDDSDDTGSKTKKKRMSQQKAAASDNAEELIPLSAKRFVSISEFRGKKLVSIREYYTDDNGEQRPGKKGISLSLDQWEKLKDAIPILDERITGN